MNKKDAKIYCNWLLWRAECVHDLGDPSRTAKAGLKLAHSFRVADHAEAISKSLDDDEDTVRLAYVCGLLHDAGRFPQVEKYDTFWDEKSIDHGAAGAAEIREAGLPDPWIDILTFVSKYHNRYALEGGDGIKEKMLKIARDADKLDIFGVNFHYHTDEDLTGDISEEFLSHMRSGKCVPYSIDAPPVEHQTLPFSWIFDINYPYSINTIREKDLFGKTRSYLPHSTRIDEVYTIAMAELERRSR